MSCPRTDHQGACQCPHGSLCSFPEIGKPAPDFSALALVDGHFRDIKLSDYKGQYVALLFYPLDFTLHPPTELIAFSDQVAAFSAINTQVIAASTDSHFCHLAWNENDLLGKVKIPLLSDKNTQISRTYGVYRQSDGMTLRGLFIIDDKGILRQITINDLPVDRSVDETLRLVQAFQIVEREGVKCPANWKPGSATIKSKAPTRK